MSDDDKIIQEIEYCHSHPFGRILARGSNISEMVDMVSFIRYMLANKIRIATAAVHWLQRVGLRILQLSLDFFVDLFQFFLGELLHGPSNDQPTLVGFRRFRDDVEMNVRNDLGNNSSAKDCKYQMTLRFSPGERSFRCSGQSRYMGTT